MRLVRTVHLDAFFYARVRGWAYFFFLRDVSIKYVMHDILYRMQHLSLQERAAFSATVCLRRCGKIVMHILMRSRDGAWAQYITHLAGNRVRSLRNLTLFATSRLLFCSSPVSVWGWSAPFTLMHFLCMGGGWAKKKSSNEPGATPIRWVLFYLKTNWGQAKAKRKQS